MDRTQNLEKIAEEMPFCRNENSKGIENYISFTQVPFGLAGRWHFAENLKEQYTLL
jgi:hydroxymethylglutaryl-CoA reductase